jgi:hypothetical protein
MLRKYATKTSVMLQKYATKAHQLSHADLGYIYEILTGLTLNLKIHQEY